MCFHHADGFFNLPVFVGIKDCMMFVVDLCLDAGFLAVLVGENRDSASQSVGGFGQLGVVAVAVEDQMKCIGAVAPGFGIS